jgi:hypothetical protein
MLKRKSASSNLRFGTLWILATTIGLCMGMALSVWQAAGFFSPARNVLQLCAAAVLEMLPLGLCQWFVLRRYMKDTQWWVPATLLASFIYYASAAWLSVQKIPGYVTLTMGFPTVSSFTILSGAVLGLVLGSCQWLVLRRRIENALWWIPTNVLAFGIGVALAEELAHLLGILVPLSTGFNDVNYYPIHYAIVFVFTAGVAALVICAITLSVLLRLLQRV